MRRCMRKVARGSRIRLVGIDKYRREGTLMKFQGRDGACVFEAKAPDKALEAMSLEAPTS